MPYEFASFTEELTAWALLGIVTISLFFLVRLIEFIDNYGHFIYLEKPLKCKKCHVTFNIFRSCVHAKHTRIAPFVVAFFFISLLPYFIFVAIPFFDSLPPLPVKGWVYDQPEPVTIFTLIDKYVKPFWESWIEHF